MYRCFTVDEVNALVPTLEVLMGELLRHAHRLHDAVVEVAARCGMHPNQVGTKLLLQEQPEIGASLEAIRSLEDQIVALRGRSKGSTLASWTSPASGTANSCSYAGNSANARSVTTT